MTWVNLLPNVIRNLDVEANMDTADKAQAAFEGLEDRMLQYALSRRKQAVKFKGHCHFCYEEVPSPNAFCDKFCQEDWEKEERMRSINGKV